MIIPCSFWVYPGHFEPVAESRRQSCSADPGWRISNHWSPFRPSPRACVRAHPDEYSPKNERYPSGIADGERSAKRTEPAKLLAVFAVDTDEKELLMPYER